MFVFVYMLMNFLQWFVKDFDLGWSSSHRFQHPTQLVLELRGKNASYLKCVNLGMLDGLFLQWCLWHITEPNSPDSENMVKHNIKGNLTIWSIGHSSCEKSCSKILEVYIADPKRKMKQNRKMHVECSLVVLLVPSDFANPVDYFSQCFSLWMKTQNLDSKIIYTLSFHFWLSCPCIKMTHKNMLFKITYHTLLCVLLSFKPSPWFVLTFPFNILELCS